MSTHDQLDLFLNALDTAPIGFCLIDAKDLTIHYANADLGSILMIGQDIHGKTLKDLMPESFITYIFNHNHISFEKELSVSRDGIKTRWIKVMGEHLTHNQNPVYALWIIDITNEKENAQRYKDAMKDADALSEMKSNLLATMSHEIRTPMQSIFGFLEVIGEMSKDNTTITDMVKSAKVATNGLLEILDDALDLAKLDAAKMELDSFEVPLRTLARGTIEAISARGHVNVTLLDDVKHDVPFVVKGDPKRLRQIIMNLMTNAVKFTKNGFVTLRISTDIKHITLPNKDDQIGLRFEVIDTGLGMPKEVCDKLFSPFTQADSSTTRQFGGTGLGLSICKKLVELMGGEIGVMSEPGIGSTFWFEFPTEAVSTDTKSITLPSLDGLAILVVEDHPQGQKEIENSLYSMNAKVETCNNYQEALELVKRRPFDIGVIDQALPDGLGVDLMREISELRPTMGLVMYTVRDDYGLQHSIRAMGATYLSKPASRVGLGEAIRAASLRDKNITLRNSRRVLIAEDNPSVTEILKKQISLLGVDATFVPDGKQAYDLLKKEEFGLLITDLHMPELDGYGLVTKIRAEESGMLEADNDNKAEERLPVIVLTADVQMAQRRVYLTEGFDECLLKPVSLGQLKQLLVRWGVVNENNALAQKDKTTGENNPASEQRSNKASPKKPSVDLSRMKEQMGAVNADTIGMLGMFSELTEPLVEEIRTHFDNQDANALKNAAHSLKGSARSACCNILGDIASDLQDNALQLENCEELVIAIETEFENVQKEIAELLQEYAS